jgi:N-acetyl-alpha-D-glucosaminyl L-malate synthase BshA
LYIRPKQASAERAVFAAPEEKILVHLSNFRPVKRVGDVIEIFDRVQKVVPSRLLMIGDGPDRPSAEWEVRRRGLLNRVFFLGKQDNVQEKLAISDLMLMPSELESFGLAALEAMACEVPTIATNAGGVPELIEDGKNGFLAAVGDVDRMAQCAIAILSDEKRLREMGKLARFEAQSRFCASRIIPRYEQFYREVLERAS